MPHILAVHPCISPMPELSFRSSFCIASALADLISQVWSGIMPTQVGVKVVYTSLLPLPSVTCSPAVIPSYTENLQGAWERAPNDCSHHCTRVPQGLRTRDRHPKDSKHRSSCGREAPQSHVKPARHSRPKQPEGQREGTPEPRREDHEGRGLPSTPGTREESQAEGNLHASEEVPGRSKGGVGEAVPAGVAPGVLKRAGTLFR